MDTREEKKIEIRESLKGWTKAERIGGIVVVSHCFAGNLRKKGCTNTEILDALARAESAAAILFWMAQKGENTASRMDLWDEIGKTNDILKTYTDAGFQCPEVPDDDSDAFALCPNAGRCQRVAAADKQSVVRESARDGRCPCNMQHVFENVSEPQE